jgi:hypothetical protein
MSLGDLAFRYMISINGALHRGAVRLRRLGPCLPRAQKRHKCRSRVVAAHEPRTPRVAMRRTRVSQTLWCSRMAAYPSTGLLRRCKGRAL